jgi:hypothetical protein
VFIFARLNARAKYRPKIKNASQDQNGAIQPFVGPYRQHSIDPCGPQQWSILYRLQTAPAGRLKV